MKILQICNKPPFPPIDGGAIATNQITQGFITNDINIKVLSVDNYKYKFNFKNLPQDYIEKTSFESVNIDLDIKPFNAFLNLFTSKSYNIERFRNKEFEKKLIDILNHEEFDIIHCESLFVTPYINTIKQHSKGLISLRAHNIEHWIWERLAQGAKNPLKKWYLKLLASRLKKYEIETLNKIDVLVAITDVDAENFKKLGCTKPIITIPIGINISELPSNNIDIYKQPIENIFHLGSMNWLPNIEGVEWFLDKVFPVIESRFSEIKLYLAGRSMPENIFNKAKSNIIVDGEVENAYEYINNHQIMIVPILSGGGMRVKIIENMALGKAIISTTLGAEGITVCDNENILIANTPEEFVLAIEKLMNNSELLYKISNNAIKLVKEKYDSNTLSLLLIKFYQQQLLFYK